MADELVEPIKPDEAKRLILEILKSGTVTYSRHAKEDKVKTDRMAVVICFRSKTQFVLVTAWRKKK